MYLNVFMYSAETESASEPTPGPSGEQQRVNVQSSLAIEIKKNKSGKAADNKNIKKMSAAQRKELAHSKDIKQVGNYRMPELPTSKGKGKGKRTVPDERQWITCPLLPGVPSIPPARVLQPWEKVQSVHAKETTNDDVIQGTPSPLSLQGPCLAAEESHDDIIEGTPPKCHQEDSFLELTQRCLKRVKEDINLTTPQAKRSCIRFSPSTGIVQVMEVSFPPVVADIELINCTPTTSTRTEAFDSGRSARSNLSIEIDVQIERDLEVNSGSEIDEEENVVDRLIGCTTGEDAQKPCPTELNELLQLDSTEDQAIRNMAAGDMDVLSFNWCADYNNFEGVQEEFSGPSGPTFDHSVLWLWAREGIKSYELCESRTGYLWKMEVYSGKGHVHAQQEAGAVPVVGYEAEIEPENATSKIVYTLLRPLFGRGHTVVMDNFYNSPLLSRLLKSQHKTDTMGTLRLNREFVPEALKVKNKTTMKSGEVFFSSTKDLCVLVYMDKNIVPMISTYHRPEVGGIEKYDRLQLRRSQQLSLQAKKPSFACLSKLAKGMYVSLERQRYFITAIVSARGRTSVYFFTDLIIWAEYGWDVHLLQLPEFTNG
ncbi:unnamed protein product [Arctia plantaginis]|uniref:PiggyBac transposable element-derived protein domain-containing protein n=1 Tax=Arctia plantaginis TaxID=874455 RepID=A0A8S1AI25_ARCPL|nr:unnamed protein product [Arctia plantaginis]